MKGGSTKVAADLAFFVDDQGFNTGQRQLKTRHQTYWPSATNQYRNLLHQKFIR
jgi:hypothetical protein